MLETKTFKKYEPEEYRPGLHIQDEEELVKAGSDYALKQYFIQLALVKWEMMKMLLFQMKD